MVLSNEEGFVSSNESLIWDCEEREAFVNSSTPAHSVPSLVFPELDIEMGRGHSHLPASSLRPPFQNGGTQSVILLLSWKPVLLPFLNVHPVSKLKPQFKSPSFSPSTSWVTASVPFLPHRWLLTLAQAPPLSTHVHLSPERPFSPGQFFFALQDPAQVSLPW